MLDQNLKEFEILKKELSEIKSTITVFLNIAIGGSLLGTISVFLLKEGKETNTIPIALSMFISFFLILIMYILNYKYISHNRYVGYIRLLSQEISHEKVENIGNHTITISGELKNLVLFDYCMAKLQKRYNKIDHPEMFEKNLKPEFLENLEFEFIKDREVVKWDYEDNKEQLEKMFEQYRLKNPLADKNSFGRGMKLLLLGMFKMDCSNSWKYPFYISYPIILNISFFVALGWRHFVLAWEAYSQNIWRNIISYYIIIMTIFICLLLIKIIKELYQVMNGSKTINAFCWKFLRHRVAFLNEIDIKPYFGVVDIDFKVSRENSNI